MQNQAGKTSKPLAFLESRRLVFHKYSKRSLYFSIVPSSVIISRFSSFLSSAVNVQLKDPVINDFPVDNGKFIVHETKTQMIPDFKPMFDEISAFGSRFYLLALV